MTTREHKSGSASHPKADKDYHTNVSQTLRKIDSGPSNGCSDHPCPRQVPVDLIEEEGMESFPASDPPGHLRSHTSDKPEPHRPSNTDV